MNTLRSLVPTLPACVVMVVGLAPALARAVPISAKDLLTGNPAATSGIYAIDPDGAGAGGSFEVYADMVTAGGGWTLGVHSLNGNGAATTDMVANTGTAALGTGHTRDLHALAIDQDAQIRHVLRSVAGQLLFDGYYTGNYHGTVATAAGWTIIAGDINALGLGGAPSFHSILGRPWSTAANDVDGFDSGNCATIFGVPWYYGACWTAIPTEVFSGGPRFNSNPPLGEYSIYVRELASYAVAVPEPSSLVLFALGLVGCIAPRLRRRAPIATRERV